MFSKKRGKRRSAPWSSLAMPWKSGSLGLVERWDRLARFALARMREVLTIPLPPADDLSTEAQSKHELLLLVAETAIGHARALGVIFLRQILLSPGLENHEGFGWN